MIVVQRNAGSIDCSQHTQDLKMQLISHRQTPQLVDGLIKASADIFRRSRSAVKTTNSIGFLTPSPLVQKTIRSFNFHHITGGRGYVTTSLAQSPANINTRPRSFTRCRETIKRKVALVIGYDGANYHGIQRNPGVETVSDVLEKALHAAGGISNDNVGFLEKVKWQTAARTDRGVGAAGNLVSLKILLRKEEDERGEALQQIQKRINDHLPQHIRVFDIFRVTNSFSSKSCCGARWYEYILPLSAFPSDFCLNDFDKLLRQFEGTHLFHNYTIGTDHSIPPRNQARRFIMEAKCDLEHLIISPTDETEKVETKWIRLRFKGQSFMLHQIRKMVSMALITYSAKVSEDAIKRSFYDDLLINVPPAPGSGLFLDSCHFDWYNERHEKSLLKPISTIKFDHERSWFKKQFLLPSIARRMTDDGLLDIYWETVNKHFTPF